ncbi:MAG TPA: PDZ domain-containing protein, partial [Chroococcales cyanobacterium]
MKSRFTNLALSGLLLASACAIDLQTVALCEIDTPASQPIFGITFAQSAEGPRVDEVTPGSAADKNGIAKGDVLKSVDGANVAALTPQALKEKLAAAVPAGVSLKLRSPQKGFYTVSLTKNDAIASVSGVGSSSAASPTAAASTASKATETKSDSSAFPSAEPEKGGKDLPVGGSQYGQAPQNWQSYSTSNSGYSVQHPEGWQLASDPKSGRIDMANAAGVKLSILPFFVAGNKLTPADAPEFFAGALKNFAPSVNWSKPSQASQNAWKSECKTAS